MDRTLAYIAGCLFLTVVAVCFSKLVYDLLRDASAFQPGKRVLSAFYAAFGVALVMFIMGVVFSATALWQASGLALLCFYLASWALPKPY